MLTSPSSSFTCTVTPKGTFPGGYSAHLFKKGGYYFPQEGYS